MAAKGAQFLTIERITTADRLLRILQLLNDASGLILNEDVIYTALPRIGHAPSFVELRNDLMCLNELRLIDLRLIRPWVAKLLPRGVEVAIGRNTAEGVARIEAPSPD